jgi:hypothetical protein
MDFTLVILSFTLDIATNLLKVAKNAKSTKLVKAAKISKVINYFI